MTPKPEHEPSFYSWSRKGWRYGCMWLHVAASIVYLALSLLPLVQFIINDFQIPSWVIDHPLLVLSWAVFAALGYPVWAWQEARVFERWVRNVQDEDARKVERAYFMLQASLAKNFWTAVFAIYTVGSLVGVAMK